MPKEDPGRIRRRTARSVAGPHCRGCARKGSREDECLWQLTGRIMADMEDRDEVPQRLKRSEDEGGTTWYFAYGSNMRNSVIQKRGLTAIAKINVLIPSYRLSFDVFGVPYSEPAMASITASRVPDHVCDAHPVHGVAILLSKADYVQMLVSEGAGTAYDEIVLEAIPVQGRDGIMVRTLVARYPFRPNFSPRPSRRYMVKFSFSHSLYPCLDTAIRVLVDVSRPLHG